MDVSCQRHGDLTKITQYFLISRVKFSANNFFKNVYNQN